MTKGLLATELCYDFSADTKHQVLGFMLFDKPSSSLGPGRGEWGGGGGGGGGIQQTFIPDDSVARSNPTVTLLYILFLTEKL